MQPLSSLEVLTMTVFQVSYLATGFLDKNKDTLQEDIVSMLKKSTVPLVRGLLSEESEQEDISNRGRSNSNSGSFIGSTILPSLIQFGALVDDFFFLHRSQFSQREGRSTKWVSKKRLLSRSLLVYCSFPHDLLPGPPTVGAKFRRQLTELMATLSATQPHYIRCIKPNTLKVSDNFDDDMVPGILQVVVPPES